MEVTRLRVSIEGTEALLAARPKMLDAFADRPGFRRADLVQVSDAEWLDLIIWDTLDDFAESRKRGGDSPAVLAFFATIDEVVSTEVGSVWNR